MDGEDNVMPQGEEEKKDMPMEEAAPEAPAPEAPAEEMPAEEAPVEPAPEAPVEAPAEE